MLGGGGGGFPPPSPPNLVLSLGGGGTLVLAYGDLRGRLQPCYNYVGQTTDVPSIDQFLLRIGCVTAAALCAA